MTDKISEQPPALQHATIGSVQGKYGKGVVQYLGIQYATLENRFADPKVVEYDTPKQMDATMHGPPVVMPVGSAEMEMGFIQHQLPTYKTPPMSDLDGLNLNITVPRDGGINLPVLVYVHGGGFAFGSSSYPHYDQSKVVELSVIMDLPIVAVNFNYRLGIPGFLTSDELSSQGYSANRGLLDQRAALSWVKANISGFGGDPTKITMVGQSAGAASTNFMMYSEVPLFSQAILLGGSFMMMKPDSHEAAEKKYADAIHLLDLENLEGPERVRRLLSMPQERFTELAEQLASLGPVVDRKLIPSVATLNSIKEKPLPGMAWCPRVLSVDSKHDGTIFAQVNLNFREKGINHAFQEYVKLVLGTEKSAALLSFYKIGPDTSDAEALESITQFITDIAIYAPAIELARVWPGKYVVGHFNEHNPFPGRYQGKSNHLLDIAFLWGNYNQSYEKKNWTVGRALAENTISFVASRDKLPDFKATQQVVVYGPSDDGISSSTAVWDSTASERDPRVFKLAENVGGLDTLLDVAHGFLAESSSD